MKNFKLNPIRNKFLFSIGIKVIGLVLMMGNVLPFSNTAFARRIRFGSRYEVDMNDISSTWLNIRELMSNDYIFPLEDIKVVLEDILLRPSFIAPVIEKLWPDGGIQIDDIDSLKVELFQDGFYYGVFKIGVTLKNGDKKFFGVNVPKTPQANVTILKDYNILKTLYQKNPRYIMEPYSLGYVSDVLGESRINIFSFAWYLEHKEILLYGRDRLCINFPPGVGYDGDVINPESSDLIKTDMIKILTIYYNPEESKAIGYYYRDGYGTWKIGIGADIDAGDFIFRNIADGSADLRLVTVRTLVTADIPHFIHGLLLHYEKRFNAPPREIIYDVFTPEQVFKGITNGLIELYGETQGKTVATQWLEKYRTAVQEGIISDARFVEDVESFLETLNDI